MESELDSDEATLLETGFTFQFPPEYEFDFTCSIKDPTQNQVVSAQITPETLTFGTRGNGETYEFEFDRLRKTFTSESHALSVEEKESLTKIFESMFDFTPLVEGKEVVLGQAIDRPVNIFGIDGNVRFKPFKFVKFNGMTGLKSHYEMSLSGNARIFGENLGYLQMTGRGVAINHLGTGFWVYSKLKGKVTAQGQRIDWFEDRNCKLKGRDKFHKSFEQVEKNISEQPETADWSKEIADYQVTISRLEKKLKALEDKEAQQKKLIDSDNQPPQLAIYSSTTENLQGIIKGRVTDNSGVAQLSVDGTDIAVQKDGSFEHRTFVPVGGLSLEFEAFDFAGLSSAQVVRLERQAASTATAIRFDRLNPLGHEVHKNAEALALIVGVESYENTTAKALFADSDALIFQDYASQKLGIPPDRIKSFVNDSAEIRDVLLGVKLWLARAIIQDQTDVYVFFAGHGLASDDGEQMYLLPFDGTPELLQETTISRDKLFSDIAAANPRSVTVFLDTCYSGATRGEDVLLASRPISIRAKEQEVPEGFTVITAAAGDQTAKPLEEAKHGMFSYFLMKGMEGDADANQDNQITAGELHAYVQQNVIQQSSGTQTPELQGDAERVLVRFQ